MLSLKHYEAKFRVYYLITINKSQREDDRPTLNKIYYVPVLRPRVAEFEARRIHLFYAFRRYIHQRLFPYNV